MPVTMFRRELISCQTHTVSLVLGSLGGLEVLIPGVVVLWIPRGDEYSATFDDGNVAGEKAQLGVMVSHAVGICRTIS